MPETDLWRTRCTRLALLLMLVALHGALLWVHIPPDSVPFGTDVADPVQLLVLPPPLTAPGTSRAEARGPARPPPRPRLQVPPSPSIPGVPAEPAPIDWLAEAALAARHLSKDAAEAGPRNLDDHSRHADHQTGLGLKQLEPPEFGWDGKHLHPVVPLEGGGLGIWLGEHCMLTLAPLPFMTCGIGKIPARGDLFEHMRESPGPLERDGPAP